MPSVAATAAWRRLHGAMLARRPLTATVIGHTDRGPRVEVLGLYAVLSRRTDLQPGQEVEVRITRMTDGLLETFRHWRTVLRGSVIGTVVGAIPGAISATSAAGRDRPDRPAAASDGKN